LVPPVSSPGEVITTLPVLSATTWVPKPLPGDGCGSMNSGKGGPARREAGRTRKRAAKARLRTKPMDWVMMKRVFILHSAFRRG
jgi:hypothetical protein